MRHPRDRRRWRTLANLSRCINPLEEERHLGLDGKIDTRQRVRERERSGRVEETEYWQTACLWVRCADGASLYHYYRQASLIQEIVIVPHESMATAFRCHVQNLEDPSRRLIVPLFLLFTLLPFLSITLRSIFHPLHSACLSAGH